MDMHPSSSTELDENISSLADRSFFNLNPTAEPADPVPLRNPLRRLDSPGSLSSRFAFTPPVEDSRCFFRANFAMTITPQPMGAATLRLQDSGVSRVRGEDRWTHLSTTTARDYLLDHRNLTATASNSLRYSSHQL